MTRYGALPLCRDYNVSTAWGTKSTNACHGWNTLPIESASDLGESAEDGAIHPGRPCQRECRASVAARRAWEQRMPPRDRVRIVQKAPTQPGRRSDRGVEPRRFELLTSCLQSRRSTN